VDLIGLHFLAQGGVHLLVALDQAQALELLRDDRGIPMAAIALYAQVLARQLAGDDGFELISCHGFIREF
jgi:hypothetical protein